MPILNRISIDQRPPEVGGRLFCYFSNHKKVKEEILNSLLYFRNAT
ncbi:MAG: hypothetical protein PHU62_03555 [Bacteroidales bacterium]|nr:hypothetical protein [Bacteroidales bacterium]MDD3152872.1 hypothetical protein [Bacteroidales bacterium]MDD3913593.1 hypothetical protein [Bacteroidales bacterium]MDD4633639.1 hypothetical protein [Bacteroidales bacterium]